MPSLVAFEPFLELVEAELERQLAGESSDTLGAAARYLCVGTGAKRARPILTRIFGSAIGVDDAQLVAPAVAAELIHGASLLHDDVVDTGMFRRGRPTVNARWGNVVAVLSGDVVLSRALWELHKANPRTAARALQTVSDMSRAAFFEVNSRGELDLTLAQLKAIAEGKTGSLFGFCGVAAAYAGGEEEAEHRFNAFGRRIGIAFQMADDIRDITGTDDGKPQFADISSRTMSLPLLLAVEGDPRLKRRLREVWSWSGLNEGQVRELGAAVIVSGAVDHAIEIMNIEIEGANDALGRYAHTESGYQLTVWARALAQGMALKGAA